jgi:hypothetical protein
MLREDIVFNVDQCDDLPAAVETGKPMCARNPDTRNDLADEFLRSAGADIREGATAKRRSILRAEHRFDLNAQLPILQGGRSFLQRRFPRADPLDGTQGPL